MLMAALSGDEQRIIFSKLCNVLDPRAAVAFGSASSELRALTQAERQQLSADFEAATALGWKAGKGSCKELREAKAVGWHYAGLSFDIWHCWARWARCCRRSRSCTSTRQQPGPTACSGWLRSWARARCRL